jgi:nucleotide-binding universal stress UspA family protein
MKTFSVKFTAGNLPLDAIVSVSDNHHKYKVELVTGEPQPILLKRSSYGEWSIENQGQRLVSPAHFEALQNAIDEYLQRLYSGNKILVLTDFSSSAENAATYAAALSKQFNSSTIVLYHSHEYLPIVTTNYAPLAPQLVHSAEESLRKLSQLQEHLKPLVSADTDIQILGDGRALPTAVNAIVDQQHIGLVVMGITGKSALEKTLVGSNTVTISHSCTVPLLVVPEQASYHTVSTIAFACDLKNVIRTIPVYPIGIFISGLQAQLSILYVNKVDGKVDTGTKTELEKLHSIWDEKAVKYHYTDHENIEEGIMDYADEHHIDLLLTVAREYGFIERIFHKSLTRTLTYRTHIPLLIFKEDL